MAEVKLDLTEEISKVTADAAASGDKKDPARVGELTHQVGYITDTQPDPDLARTQVAMKAREAEEKGRKINADVDAANAAAAKEELELAA